MSNIGNAYFYLEHECKRTHRYLYPSRYDYGRVEDCVGGSFCGKRERSSGFTLLCLYYYSTLAILSKVYVRTLLNCRGVKKSSNTSNPLYPEVSVSNARSVFN